MAGKVLLLPKIRYKVATATWKSPVGHLKCGPKGKGHVSGQCSIILINTQKTYIYAFIFIC